MECKLAPSIQTWVNARESTKKLGVRPWIPLPYSECHSSLLCGAVGRVPPTRIKHIVCKWESMLLSDVFLYPVFPVYQVAGDLHLGCQHVDMVILKYTIQTRNPRYLPHSIDLNSVTSAPYKLKY